MTKRFCDLCDEPADANFELAQIDVPFPKKRKEMMHNNRMARIKVRVLVNIHDHPTGFGGHPDLCKNCLKQLLQKLVNGLL